MTRPERGWQNTDVRIVHFGSPPGTTFGDHDRATIEEFESKYPDFVIAEVSS